MMPDGREIYVTNVGGETVSVIDNATLTVIATIPVGKRPWHVAITPDGAWAYVSNSQSKSVSVIDTGTRSVVKTLAVGAGPFFSAIDPSGSKLYVSNSEGTTVSVIDLSSQTVVQTISGLGSQPFDLLFDGPQSLGPTPTPSPSPTETPTPSPTETPTPTPSPTETPTPSPSETPTPTPSPTETPTPSPSETPTPTPSPTETPTPSPSPTETPTPSPTETPTPTPTSTPTPTPTLLSPAIATQPASKSVTVGQTAKFSVVATGTAPLSYQWRKNTVSIAGATRSSYITPPITAGDNGTLFSVVVTNSAGSVTSNNATLTVKTPPSITTQPANKTVAVGQTAKFTVAATGSTPFKYQWKKNGVNITGATKASYTTPPATPADNGSLFAVIVSNSVASVTSNNATLTVQ